MLTPHSFCRLLAAAAPTRRIVKSLMVRLHDFPAEIRLYDIDEARQNTIAPVVEKVIRDHSQSIKFTVTSDPEVAFSGAHFVLLRCASDSTKCASRMKNSAAPRGGRRGNLRTRRAGIWPAYDPADGRADR